MMIFTKSLNFLVGDKNLQSPPPKMNNFEVWLATIGVGCMGLLRTLGYTPEEYFFPGELGGTSSRDKPGYTSYFF